MPHEFGSYFPFLGEVGFRLTKPVGQGRQRLEGFRYIKFFIWRRIAPGVIAAEAASVLRSKSLATASTTAGFTMFLLIHKSAHQAVLAQEVHHARDAIRELVNRDQRFRIKNRLPV